MIAVSMRRDAIVAALAGIFFGLLVGWILGSQQARPVPAPAAAAASGAPNRSERPQAPPLDTERAASLEQRATAAPQDAVVRAQLGNLYLDAERPDLAIPWYEAAWRLDSKNVDVSTDLGIAYFRVNQVDRALAQLDLSLAADPKNLKALFNQGIVHATGKRDFAAASKSLQKIIDIAPSSEEARLAREALSAIASGHAGSGKSGSGKS
jgi:tetratricopeptide (TPR) repeat protein